MNWMINTLRYVKALEKVGVDRKVAECQAEALAEALDGGAQTVLATKSDLQKTEKLLRTDIQKLEGDMQQLELRLTKQMNTVMIKTITILGSLMVLMGGAEALLHFY